MFKTAGVNGLSVSGGNCNSDWRNRTSILVAHAPHTASLISGTTEAASSWCPRTMTKEATAVTLSVVVFNSQSL